MLLEALVACAGVTLNAVATARGIELRDALLQAEGDLDFRGTLGMSKEAPVGYQNIRLEFTLDTDASADDDCYTTGPCGPSTAMTANPSLKPTRACGARGQVFFALNVTGESQCTHI